MAWTEDTFVRYIDVELPFEKSTRLSIHQQKVGDVGCVVWDAPLVLAHYLQTDKARNQYILNKNVIELGSGTGVVGLVAAACGAKEVVLTDLAESVPLLNKNITENMHALKCSEGYMKVVPYKWGSKEDLQHILNDQRNEAYQYSHDFSYILVADCVYYKQAVFPLAQSINDLLVQGKNGTVALCSYEDRDTTDKSELQEEFRKILTDTFHLKIKFVPFREMHYEFRSHDIHIFSVSRN